MYMKNIAMKNKICIYLFCVLIVLAAGCVDKNKINESIDYSDCKTDKLLCRLSKYDLQERMKSLPRPKDSLANVLSSLLPGSMIPQKTDIIADGPRYFLCQDPNTQEFWLLRTSGFLGEVTEWRGPLHLDINAPKLWVDD